MDQNMDQDLVMSHSDIITAEPKTKMANAFFYTSNLQTHRNAHA